MKGGSGTDTVVFSYCSNRINLAKGSRQNTKDGRDILTSIENVKEGKGNDLVTGNDENNVLKGEGGKDTLIGGRGNDKLYGGSSHDLLYGNSGNDLLTGGKGRDTLNGGSGKDVFVISQGTGRDVIEDFSDGIDKILLGTASSSVSWNLKIVIP